MNSIYIHIVLFALKGLFKRLIRADVAASIFILHSLKFEKKKNLYNNQHSWAHSRAGRDAVDPTDA